MLTRRIRLQVLAFCVLAAVGLTYVAAKYVGLGRLVGLSGYTVTVDLPRTGGLFENAEVTYRGVPVGRVGDLQVRPDSVRAEVLITRDSLHIPRDLDLVVANRSAIGEQYLDLRPRTDGGPWLAAGDRLSVDEEHLPLQVDRILEHVVDLNDSVPTDDLRTVVEETYDASRNAGDDLNVLLETSSRLADQAGSNLDVTTSLIRHAEGVLRTQAGSGEDIRTFSRSFRQLAGTLADSDADVRRIIRTAPGTAAAVADLIRVVGAPLSALMGDLLTLDEVLADRGREIEDVLVRAPRAVQAVAAAISAAGLRMGLIVNFTDPLPCTNGYEGTSRRGPMEVGPRALDRDSHCRSGLVRGAGSAPQGAR